MASQRARCGQRNFKGPPVQPLYAAQMAPESLKPLPQQLSRTEACLQHPVARSAKIIPVEMWNSQGRPHERPVAVVVEASYNTLLSTATFATISIAGTV
eukprot:8147572-Karenia_brevis.AAC.1